MLAILQGMIPFLHIFVSSFITTYTFSHYNCFKLQKDANMGRTEEVQKTMYRIGMQLIAEKEASILRANGKSIENKDVYERDWLTLLIKANMATDIPENQRRTDEDVLVRE
jgi:hypothetical protein